MPTITISDSIIRIKIVFEEDNDGNRCIFRRIYLGNKLIDEEKIVTIPWHTDIDYEGEDNE